MTIHSVLVVLGLCAWNALNAQSDTATVRIVHEPVCDARITWGVVQGLPHLEATVTSKDGEAVHFRGVLLKEVMAKACSSVAEIDKRTMVASAVRIEALDGCKALMPLTETDGSFRAMPVLLTWERNGQPMDEHVGPFQLIVPDDQRHARNVRRMAMLEVITL